MQLEQQGILGKNGDYARERAKEYFSGAAELLLEELVRKSDHVSVLRVAGELGGYVVTSDVSDEHTPSLAAISAGVIDMNVRPYHGLMRVVYGFRVAEVSERVRAQYEEIAR